ncbi:P-loop NTPase fold protein [Robiginitomaculum antarcticum]|uniref:P-loop NTPase fold protein n=1 Tax=Robiginitomaculum antarcticum TaxID=437507 RepID=UPI0003639E18|nr:P-loop NTPase fold protein [Robiginitomaculum antarcticum]
MKKSDENEFQLAKRVSDLPAESDFFSGAGHTRTANALANGLIELANEDGAIGLEGDWGSGKSTVIKLAKAFIDSKSSNSFDYRFFEFDLWIHQTDDFKRAFLISFLNWLNDEALISNSSFKEFNDKIRSRKTVTTTQDRAAFSNTAKCLFVAILITPLFLVLTRWQLAAEGGLNWWLLAPFLFLSISPLIVALFSVGYHYVKAQNDAGSAVMSLIKGQAKETTRKQFIRDENPTSTEFRQTFNEILAKVKHGKNQKEKRFVIVLDNIDRLPEDNIPDVWAELRTFYAYSTSSPTSSDHPITVIVPYDKKHILNCLVNPRSDDSGNAELGPHNEDIFHKTFMSTYRVSAPVISDVKSFFVSQIEDAFGKQISEDDAVKIYQLFNHWMLMNKRKESPRLIKSFINELVTLWNTRGNGDIPIMAIALYSLRRGAIEGNSELLKKSAYGDKFTSRHLSDIDWPKFVAALHFNVEPDLAYQALLGDEIRNSLFREDSSALVDMEGHPGFIAQLLATVDESIGSLDNRTDLPILRGLMQVKELTVLSDHEKNNILGAFVNHVSSLSQKDPISDVAELLEGLLYPLEHFGAIYPSKATSYAFLVQAYLQELLQNHEATEDEENHTYGRQWFTVYSKFLQTVEEHATESTLETIKEKEIKWPTPEHIFGMASIKSEMLSTPIEDLNIPLEAKLNTPFESRIEKSAEQLNQFTLRFGRSLPSTTSSVFTKLIAEHLNTDALEDAENALNLTKALLNLVENYFVKTHWKILDDSGVVYRLYSIAVKTKDFETAAKLRFHQTESFGGDIQNVTVSTHPHLGAMVEDCSLFNDRTNNNHQDIEKEVSIYSKLTSNNGSMNSTADLAIELKEPNNFYQEVFKHGVATPGGLGALVIKDIGIKFDAYTELLGEELSLELLKKFAGYSEYFAERYPAKSSVSLPENFVRKIKQLHPSKMDEIPKIIASHINTIEKDGWVASLLSEDEIAKSALLLLELGYPHGVKTLALRPALLDVTKQIIDKGFAPSTLKFKWPNFPLLMKEKSRASWTQDVVKYLGARDTLSNAELVNLFALYQHEDFSFPLEAHPKVAILKFALPLLSSDSEESSSLLTQYKDQLIKAYNLSDQSVKDELIENLDQENETHLKVGSWMGIEFDTKDTKKEDVNEADN